MKIREIFKRYIKDSNKIVFSTFISVLITFLFVLYNSFLGFIYVDLWAISISIYYGSLIIARMIALNVEKKLKNNKPNVKINIREKTYIKLSIFMFFIDLSLFTPITLMIVKPNNVVFGIIPAIIVSVYTTYKISMALINYKKNRRSDNLTYKFLRELSVVDALVSILTLQHTLIMVNGGMTEGMKLLSSISSFLVLLIIIVFSTIKMLNVLKKKEKIINKN